MNSLKILIIEDEIIIANVIKETLEKYGHVLVGIAKTYNEAINLLSASTPDLLIIDIKLKHSSEDGIAVAEVVNREFKIPFVFLTSHSDVEIFQKAKETKPAAYLFKPIRHEELIFQIELAYNHFSINRKNPTNPAIAENVFLPLNKGYEKINKNDLLFIEAAKSYANLFLVNEKKPIVLSINLGDLVQYFSTPNFYKLSRSYLINLNHVSRIELDHIYFNGYPNRLAIPQGSKNGLMKNFALIKTS